MNEILALLTAMTRIVMSSEPLNAELCARLPLGLAPNSFRQLRSGFFMIDGHWKGQGLTLMATPGSRRELFVCFDTGITTETPVSSQNLGPDQRQYSGPTGNGYLVEFAMNGGNAGILVSAAPEIITQPSADNGMRRAAPAKAH